MIFFWNRNNIFIDLQKKISLCFQFNHNVLTPQSKGKHTRSKTLGSSLKVSPSHCSLTALWLACLSCVIALINLSWQASDHWGPKLLIWYNLNPHSIHTLSLIIAVTVQSNQMLRPLQFSKQMTLAYFSRPYFCVLLFWLLGFTLTAWSQSFSLLGNLFSQSYNFHLSQLVALSIIGILLNCMRLQCNVTHYVSVSEAEKFVRI